MRDFAILMRVQLLSLANSLAPAGLRGRARGRRLALVACFVGLFVLLFAAYMALYGYALVTAGFAQVVPVLAVAVGSLAGVVFTFLKANGTMFGFADYDLVMSLPLDRRTVVGSRFAALLAAATLTGAVFMVPLYGAYFVCGGAGAGAAGVAGAPAFPLAAAALSVLLAPAAPTAAAVLVSFALTAAAARFRHANLVYIALTLVALVGVFAASLVVSFSAGSADEAGALAAMGAVASQLEGAIAVAYPPAGLAAAAVVGGAAAWPSLVGFAVISLLIPAACLEIMQRNFVRINELLHGSAGGSRVGTAELARGLRSRSPFAALVVKELRCQVGYPTYAVNAMAGYALMLIAAVAAVAVNVRGIIGGGLPLADAQTAALVSQGMGMALLLTPWVFAFCAVISPSAAVAVSMEGSGSWLMATAPVSARVLLGAKMGANALPAAAVLAVSAAILLAGGQADVLCAAEVVVTPLGLLWFVANLGMALDVRWPNFSWTSAQEVVKHGVPVLVCVLVGIVLVFALGVVAAWAAFAVGEGIAHAVNLGAGAAGALAGQLLFERTVRRSTVEA